MKTCSKIVSFNCCLLKLFSLAPISKTIDFKLSCIQKWKCWVGWVGICWEYGLKSRFWCQSMSAINIVNVGYISNIGPDIEQYYGVNIVFGTSILIWYCWYVCCIGVGRYLKPWLRDRIRNECIYKELGVAPMRLKWGVNDKRFGMCNIG